jgi:hypothetical protein
MPGKKYTENEDSSNLPEWFHTCKSRKVFRYDTKRYPFRELIADWLQIPSSELESIHALPLPKSTTPVHPKICKAWKAAGMPRLSAEARRSDAATQQASFTSPGYAKLMDAYRRFMQEVIAPLCTTSDNTNVVYQSPPTTRVVLPGGKPTISLHSDKEYLRHQAGEINFWLPLTTVWGSNSLWLESKPNLGDFEPIALQYGEVLRFDGYDCRHYTVPNETPDCRVSFDFRAIPSQLCTQRRHCGDFCVEETTESGYIAYPHKFWKISRGIDVTLGKEDEVSPLEFTLNSS